MRRITEYAYSAQQIGNIVWNVQLITLIGVRDKRFAVKNLATLGLLKGNNYSMSSAFASTLNSIHLRYKTKQLQSEISKAPFLQG